jgi:hypothetical protein
VSKESNNNHRYFLGATARTIAGVLLGMIGAAKAKPSQMTVADATALPSKLNAAAEDKSIRPFRVNVPDADLVDLR